MEQSTNLKKSTSKPSLYSSRTSLSLRTPQERSDQKDKPDIPDGGFGWVIVFATFMIYAIAEGVSFVFGLIFVELKREFDSSDSATSLIGSLFMALPLLAGPICSALVDQFGCRMSTIIGSFLCAVGFVLSSYAQSIGVLYFTFGIIGGICRGVVYVTAVVSVAFWFEEKRSVALGISASGTGVGTMICSPLTAYLLREFGWRGTFLNLGGLVANMCICGVLMLDPKWVKEEEKEKRKNQRLEKSTAAEKKKLLNESGTPVIEKSWYSRTTASTAKIVIDFFKSFKMFLELHFFLLSFGIFIAASWFLVPFFYLSDHMEKNNYTKEQSSFTLSAIGFTNTIGMIFLGWLAGHLNTAKTFGVSLILCSLSIWSIMFFTSNYILLVISSASFGFFFASCFALSPALLAQLVPLDDFTMGYGLILLAEGAGHLLGPPIAGFITDVTQSWMYSFYVAGLWVIISGVLIGLIPFVKNRGFFGHKLTSQTENGNGQTPGV